MKKRALSRTEIIEMIIAKPPTNIDTFAREVGCSRRIIAHVVKELEAAGVIAPRPRSNRFLWEEALEEVLNNRRIK